MNKNKAPFWLVFPAIAILGLTACGGDEAGEGEPADDVAADVGVADVVETNEESAAENEQTPVASDEPEPEPEEESGPVSDGSSDTPVTAYALPAVNAALATTTPAGIWMLSISEESQLPNEDDSMNPFLFSNAGKELVVINDNGDGVYVLTRCDSGWRVDGTDDGVTFTSNDDGYSWTKSETSSADESGVETTATTSLEVIYSEDNQMLTATGSIATTPVGENLTLTVNGVKISDETDFTSSDELSFAYALDYVSLGNEGSHVATTLQCIGVLEGSKTTEAEDDIWQVDQVEYTYFSDEGEQVQFYRFDQNIDGVENRTLGAVVNANGLGAILINSCATDNADCMAAATLVTDVTESDSSLSFSARYDVIDNDYVVHPLAVLPWTAFLWPHDGDFYDADISVTVGAAP